MQTQPHITFAKVLAFAALALFVAAPASFADSTATAPNFPSAVPSQPGVPTGQDASSSAARAQERYYSSYGEPTPLSPLSESADDGGVDWASIGIAVGGTCLLAGALIALVTRTRRRTGRAHVAA